MKILLIMLIALIALFIIGFFIFEPGPRIDTEQFLNTETDLDSENPIFFYEAVSQDAITDDKDLSEKIGQMIMLGFRGAEISRDSYVVKVLKEVKPGGVILYDYDVPSQTFPRNILNPLQTKNLIAHLQEYSSIPLFIGVDAEGGEVHRLKEEYGFSFVPGAEQLARLDDVKITQKIAEELAKELAELGFNINFAPVIDLNINPNNPVIGALGRSFSSDPERVFQQGNAFIKGHDSQNIITAIKHFPGHGSSFKDSHLGTVDITETYEQAEIVPYQKLIAQGFGGMVMVAHVINKEVDPDFPATLSPAFITGILREELGFEGVVVSDDMHMGAIINHYDFKEAIVRAVQAGVDLLLISNNVQDYDKDAAYKARDALLQAVEQGKISEQRINQSYIRIMELKHKIKL
jgi:beta-N-acetylhexosaminidase